MKTGPGMIRDENGRLSGYVYVDVSGRDIGSYVRDAKAAVAGISTIRRQFAPEQQLFWRPGRQVHRRGIGWGGHCVP